MIKGDGLHQVRPNVQGDDKLLLANSASTYRGHVFVNTRYLMLSKAASNISSVNWLGTILRVLAVLEPLAFESILAGRFKLSSQGHTTFSRSRVGETGLARPPFGMYGSYSTSANVCCNLRKILYSMLIGVSAVKGLIRVKKMSDASVNIWRRCEVVTIRSVPHFFL